MNRTERQLIGVKKWIDNGMKGTIVAATGFGKSYMAKLAVDKIKPTSVRVIVPSILLKQQWEEKYGILATVVNTAYKIADEINEDMIIADECHSVSMSDVYSQFMQKAKFNKFLGLTASIKRQDGKHIDFLKQYPKVDEIKLSEAIKNNWISDYKIINKAIKFTPEELEEYNKIDKHFTYYVSRLGGRGDIAFNRAKEYLKSDKATDDEKKYGRMLFYKLSQRKNLIYEATNRVLETAKLIKSNSDKKIIVFSEQIAFCEALLDHLDLDSTSIIHSNMRTRRIKEEFEKFVNNEVNVILSAKKLNTGIDIPDADLGIIAQGTSSKIQMTQITGRLLRKAGDNKLAEIYNIYIPNSQDAIWLRNRTYDFPKDKISWE